MLNELEKQYGFGLITATLVESIASKCVLESYEKKSQGIQDLSIEENPKLTNCMQLEVQRHTLSALNSIGNRGWMKSFLKRH